MKSAGNRYSEPSANANAKAHTMNETEHEQFVAELLKLGDAAVSAAKKKAKTGDLISRYRALTGDARSAFFAKHSIALFAALNAAE